MRLDFEKAEKTGFRKKHERRKAKVRALPRDPRRGVTALV